MFLQMTIALWRLTTLKLTFTEQTSEKKLYKRLKMTIADNWGLTTECRELENRDHNSQPRPKLQWLASTP